MELCNTKYDRSLFIGKAVFYYKTEECDFIPLEAEVSYVRGKKSSFAEGYNSNSTPKNNAIQKLSYANPLAIEECYVPPNVNNLYCRFSLRVEANSLKPTNCENIDTVAVLQNAATLFKQCGGYDELAKRYVKNILLGTWLWRNQNSGKTQITVRTSNGSVYQIADTRLLDWEGAWSEQEKNKLEQLSKELVGALTDPKRFWTADITAKVSTSFCQEVFPSQPLLTSDRKQDLQKNLSKTRCVDGREAVVLHKVKIGAAIQLIDDWWSDTDNKRLRVHEYGADQNYNIALRPPGSDNDFYSIFKELDKFKEEMENLNNAIDPKLFYFFSVLIKGGVYTKKGN